MSTEYMTHKHLKVGDRVLLTGGHWIVHPLITGKEFTVKEVRPDGADTNYNWHINESWPCVLVERDGKRVEAVLRNTNGHLNMVYVDGSTEFYVNKTGWCGSGYSEDQLLRQYAKEGWTYLFEAESSNTEPTDEQIDAALEKVRKDFGHCKPGFDAVVAKAKVVPTYLKRLEAVAEAENYVDEYEVLLEYLNLEPKVEVPEVGRWIRATTKDGKTREFEVEEITEGTNSWDGSGGEFKNVYGVNRLNEYVHIHTDPNSECGHSGTDSVMEWVYIDPPRKIKWPKGATVRRWTLNNDWKYITLDRDVYTDDEWLDNKHVYRVESYERVEITVVP